MSGGALPVGYVRVNDILHEVRGGHVVRKVRVLALPGSGIIVQRMDGTGPRTHLQWATLRRYRTASGHAIDAVVDADGRRSLV